MTCAASHPRLRRSRPRPALHAPHAHQENARLKWTLANQNVGLLKDKVLQAFNQAGDDRKLMARLAAERDRLSFQVQLDGHARLKD